MQRIADVERGVSPSEPQSRETMNLGECPRHHDVLARRDELEPRGVIVASDILAIGRVEDEEGRRFWIFRDGLYERELADEEGRPVPANWYLHGLFA